MFYCSTFLYLKFLLVWALVLMADFLLEFRFEYLWPFWLLIRSVYDSFKYQGLVSTADCRACFNDNNNKGIYIAPWFQVALFKGAVTSKKKTVKKTKAYDIKKYIGLK